MDIAPAPKFGCEVHPDRRCVSVVVSGELDLVTAPEVASTLDDLVRAGFFKVTVDLRGLTFIGSTGLRVLLAASCTAAEHGCVFTLIRGSDVVHRPFVLTGLDAEFEFESDRGRPSGTGEKLRWANPWR